MSAARQGISPSSPTSGARPLTIQLVVDNEAQPGLHAEHGFSAWIETPEIRLLFDTGQGRALLHNVDQMGIELGRADAVVVSHGHYDHTGGLPHVLKQATDARLCLHAAAVAERYAVRESIARPIGLPEAARASIALLSADRVRWIAEPIELAPGLGLTGPIPRANDYEDTGGPFFTDPDGRTADPLTDDLALWARTSEGVVVVVGCSHAGVINTLNYALRLSGATRLRAVIGGFHLVGASPERLQQTVAALRQLDVAQIIPCHCTGDRATQLLRQALGERVVPGLAGMSYRFS